MPIASLKNVFPLHCIHCLRVRHIHWPYRSSTMDIFLVYLFLKNRCYSIVVVYTWMKKIAFLVCFTPWVHCYRISAHKINPTTIKLFILYAHFSEHRNNITNRNKKAEKRGSLKIWSKSLLIIQCLYCPFDAMCH